MKDFTEQLLKRNPLLVYITGLSLAIGATVKTDEALLIGMLTTIIILVVTAATKIIRLEERYMKVIIASAGVSIAYLFIQNIYILFIGISSIVLSKNKNMLQAFGKGIGFTLVITLLGLIRELVGNGTITIVKTTIIQGVPHEGLLLAPGVAMILLGMMFAGVRAWNSSS